MSKKTTTKLFSCSHFPSDWKEYEWKDLFKHLKGQLLSKEKLEDFGKYKCILYGELFTTYNEVIYEVKSKTNRNEGTLSKHGDILMPGSTTTTGLDLTVTSAILENDVLIGGDVNIFRMKTDLTDPVFMSYFLTHTQKKQIARVTQGTTIIHLYGGDLLGIKFSIPLMDEQKAIATRLIKWNNAIDRTEKLIIQLQLRNKWLMHQLLTGKRRIKKFIKSKDNHKTSLGILPVDWQLNSIKNILSPVKKSFSPEQNELYQQIGIRSHTKGIFYKEKVTGSIIGDKRVFWIEPNCFIVNIVFAWEHAITRTTEKEIGMIASHRFPMFKPKEGIIDLDYLLYYFKSPRGKHLLGLASPGGAGRNKTLGQSEFLKLLIPVPPLKEQIAIAELLNVAEKELELLKTKLEQLKTQKMGLTQTLLTGKKRLNVLNNK